jgi:hypothetical protein
MVLALYRRHRRDCKARHLDESRTSEYDGGVANEKKGLVQRCTDADDCRDETSIKTRRPAVVSCTASLKVEADAIRILKTIASTRIG